MAEAPVAAAAAHSTEGAAAKAAASEGAAAHAAESAAHRCNLRVLAFRCLQITHRLQVPLIEFLQAAVVERRMAENMRIARPAHALISLRAVGRNVDKVAFL